MILICLMKVDLPDSPVPATKKDAVGQLILKTKDVAGNTNYRGRLSTVYLLVKVACFVTKIKNIFNIKMTDLSLLAQGG
jgi:hypothetical protein